MHTIRQITRHMKVFTVYFHKVFGCSGNENYIFGGNDDGLDKVGEIPAGDPRHISFMYYYTMFTD